MALLAVLTASKETSTPVAVRVMVSVKRRVMLFWVEFTPGRLVCRVRAVAPLIDDA